MVPELKSRMKLNKKNKWLHQIDLSSRQNNRVKSFKVIIKNKNKYFSCQSFCSRLLNAITPKFLILKAPKLCYTFLPISATQLQKGLQHK